MSFPIAVNNQLLDAALTGFQIQIAELDEKIRQLRREIGGTKETVVSEGGRSRGRTGKSAKARVAAAPPAEKAPAVKRKLSAAGRKAIAEATKKRWAAFRAAKKAAAKQSLPARKAAAKKTAAKKSVAKKAVVKAPVKTAARTAPKRKLSAEQKAALVERLKKARAAKAAKQTAGEPAAV